jgi:hypothetical protein
MSEQLNIRRQGQRMNDEERKRVQAIFLDSFRNNANVRLASAKAGVHRSIFNYWLEHDPEFSVEYHEALADANDTIRAAIFQRAVMGVEEPVVAMGHVMYDKDGKMLTVRKYSDALLMRLAAARMPEFRNEQKVEHSGSLDLNGARDSLLGKLAIRVTTPVESEQSE